MASRETVVYLLVLTRRARQPECNLMLLIHVFCGGVLKSRTVLECWSLVTSDFDGTTRYSPALHVRSRKSLQFVSPIKVASFQADNYQKSSCQSVDMRVSASCLTAVWLRIFASIGIFFSFADATSPYFDVAARMIESNVGRGQGLSLAGKSTGQIELVILLQHTTKTLSVNNRLCFQ